MRNKFKNFTNRIRSNKRLVKIATAISAVEAVTGVVGATATAMAWIALGHHWVAVLCILMYILSCACKFILGAAANS